MASLNGYGYIIIAISSSSPPPAQKIYSLFRYGFDCLIWMCRLLDPLIPYSIFFSFIILNINSNSPYY